MRTKGYMTGMLGVYLTAAELTRLGFIVSPTSRSAFGADLLVTDERCRKAWSVQVKTNGKATSFWLINAHAADSYSDSHVYVFVNIIGDSRPEYFVVPSADVAKKLHKTNRAKTGSIWHYVDKKDMEAYAKGWKQIFGDGAGEAAA